MYIPIGVCTVWYCIVPCLFIRYVEGGIGMGMGGCGVVGWVEEEEEGWGVGRGERGLGF
jgi:hypothetical protein